jgi:hypothetical protein
MESVRARLALCTIAAIPCAFQSCAASYPLVGTARVIQVADGGSHTCILFESGIALCWGENKFGQAAAPAGQFTTITAAPDHTCGLEKGGTARCWGFGPTPSGKLVKLAAGLGYTCGIQSSGELVCAGDVAGVPSGHFVDLAGGRGTICAIRTDQALVCWSTGDRQHFDVTAGPFTSISVADGGRCARLENGVLSCTKQLAANMPQGRARSFDTYGSRACAQMDDGFDIWCWDRSGATRIDFDSLAVSLGVGRKHVCVATREGELQCFGESPTGQLELGGQFTDVHVERSVCVRRSDEGVACLGAGTGKPVFADNDATACELSAPRNLSSSFGLHGNYKCHIDQRGHIQCTGDLAGAPEGTFRSIACGEFHACALSVSSDVVCWGRNRDGEADAPIGEFVAVTAGLNKTCGLRPDGTAVCWGKTLPTPLGRFRALSAGRDLVCGIRDDKTLECWGWDLSAWTYFQTPPPLFFLDAQIAQERARRESHSMNYQHQLSLWSRPRPNPRLIE